MGLHFEWDEEKNRLLMEHRHISFEMVTVAIKEDRLIDVIPSPSQHHPDQECLVVDMDGYVFLVPFVPIDNGYFLKTVYPSRKHTKIYLKDLT